MIKTIDEICDEILTRTGLDDIFGVTIPAYEYDADHIADPDCDCLDDISESECDHIQCPKFVK